jgi:hypothetical protein
VSPISQFGRPSTDTTNESYTDEGAGSTNIFNSIDESSASESDFIQSASAPTTDVYVTKLTTLEDPEVSTGHIVRYRYQKDASGGSQIDLVVQLREGYVNEGTPGTLIASNTHANISNGWTAGTFTLSAGEADAIGDYDDLFLRLTANQV